MVRIDVDNRSSCDNQTRPTPNFPFGENTDINCQIALLSVNCEDIIAIPEYTDEETEYTGDGSEFPAKQTKSTTMTSMKLIFELIFSTINQQFQIISSQHYMSSVLIGLH